MKAIGEFLKSLLGSILGGIIGASLVLLIRWIILYS